MVEGAVVVGIYSRFWGLHGQYVEDGKSREMGMLGGR